MSYNTIDRYPEADEMPDENRPPIRAASERLGEQIDTLGALLSELETRIGFVLAPEAPQNSQEVLAKRPGGCSPLLDQLLDRNDAIGVLQCRVSDLTGRIEA